MYKVMAPNELLVDGRFASYARTQGPRTHTIYYIYIYLYKYSNQIVCCFNARALVNCLAHHMSHIIKTVCVRCQCNFNQCRMIVCHMCNARL